MKNKKNEKKPLPPRPIKQPLTKEDAIRQSVEKDPERAAALLREILKGK